jgi:hypothetical protein
LSLGVQDSLGNSESRGKKGKDCASTECALPENGLSPTGLNSAKYQDIEISEMGSCFWLPLPFTKETGNMVSTQILADFRHPLLTSLRGLFATQTMKFSYGSMVESMIRRLPNSSCMEESMQDPWV